MCKAWGVQGSHEEQCGHGGPCELLGYTPRGWVRVSVRVCERGERCWRDLVHVLKSLNC